MRKKHLSFKSFCLFVFFNFKFQTIPICYGVFSWQHFVAKMLKAAIDVCTSIGSLHISNLNSANNEKKNIHHLNLFVFLSLNFKFQTIPICYGVFTWHHFEAKMTKAVIDSCTCIGSWDISIIN
jgi:hypothetical protein